MALLDISLARSDVLVSLLCMFATYLLSTGVYRLYFSPLAKFPGPKLAALTLWYEFYYDVVKRGRYTWKIAELHRQYGPIVRISPYELHINDPDFYDELYVGHQRRTMKYEWSYKGFGPTLSSFATIDHDVHRIRRGAVAPFFSKASVTRLEPSVQTLVNKLVVRLKGLQNSGAVGNLVHIYSAMTADIICNYAFASPFGMLDSPDFSPNWHQAIVDISEASHLFKQFGFIEPIMRRIPPSIAVKMNPLLGSLFYLSDMIRTKIHQVQSDLASDAPPPASSHPLPIFHSLLLNPSLPAPDKSVPRLESEGLSLVAAGSNTVAHTLSVISYHLLANPALLARLQADLATLVPPFGSKDEEEQQQQQQPTHKDLEKLPYLTAVITEGLRWGYGVTERLQRIAPDVSLRYGEWEIPRGTPVGMSTVMMHDNEGIFPEPRQFRPERWLGEGGGEGGRLRKGLVPFCRGSRQCLGMNLAYCELYLTLAAVFAPGRFKFELFETDISDVEIEHDFFIPVPRLDSKGIRVLVK